GRYRCKIEGIILDELDERSIWRQGLCNFVAISEAQLTLQAQLRDPAGEISFQAFLLGSPGCQTLAVGSRIVRIRSGESLLRDLCPQSCEFVQYWRQVGILPT